MVVPLKISDGSMLKPFCRFPISNAICVRDLSLALDEVPNSGSRGCRETVS